MTQEWAVRSPHNLERRRREELSPQDLSSSSPQDIRSSFFPLLREKSHRNLERSRRDELSPPGYAFIKSSGSTELIPSSPPGEISEEEEGPLRDLEEKDFVESDIKENDVEISDYEESDDEKSESEESDCEESDDEESDVDESGKKTLKEENALLLKKEKEDEKELTNVCDNKMEDMARSNPRSIGQRGENEQYHEVQNLLANEEALRKDNELLKEKLREALGNMENTIAEENKMKEADEVLEGKLQEALCNIEVMETVLKEKERENTELTNHCQTRIENMDHQMQDLLAKEEELKGIKG
ncbi:phosphatase and actin regulator 4A-like [Macrobrachium nipponense]|uniref:phosphatase and actin regulator 4A-like n=1 Tax=Macrobrachium nipponense TaxID=159736 RepID=UPI0030C8372B